MILGLLAYRARKHRARKSNRSQDPPISFEEFLFVFIFIAGFIFWPIYTIYAIYRAREEKGTKKTTRYPYATPALVVVIALVLLIFTGPAGYGVAGWVPSMLFAGDMLRRRLME